MLPMLVANLNDESRYYFVRRYSASALCKIALASDGAAIASFQNAARLHSGVIELDGNDSIAAENASVRIAAGLALWKASGEPAVIPWLIAQPNAHEQRQLHPRSSRQRTRRNQARRDCGYPSTRFVGDQPGTRPESQLLCRCRGHQDAWKDRAGCRKRGAFALGNGSKRGWGDRSVYCGSFWRNRSSRQFGHSGTG